MGKRFLVGLCLLALAAVASADFAVTSVNPNGSGGTPVAGSNHGWAFTVNKPIVATHLGLFDRGDDGFIHQHPIALFRENGTMLESGTLSSGVVNPLIDHFRYVEIKPTPLNVGEKYVIGYYSATADGDFVMTGNAMRVMNPDVNWLEGRWNTSGAFNMPNNVVGDDRFGPNFQFIPEPASFALLVVGLLCRRR